MVRRKILASDTMATPGPPGPPGSAGPAGAQGQAGVDGDPAFVWTQALADDVWTVSHGLGKRPAVTVVDSALSVLEADVYYTDLDNLTITFAGACAGTATLN